MSRQSEQVLTRQSLEELHTSAQSELDAVTSEGQAEQFRIKYLGKKGALRSVLKGLGGLPESERKSLGALANEIYRVIEEQFSAMPWRRENAHASSTSFDPTLPGFPFPRGSIHPLTQIRNQIRDIFVDMGFDLAYGPEVETDYHNFEALNTPPHHPARDMQDTFYTTNSILLRTHTSPVQVRVMENQTPPIRVIAPGRVYRNEEISARSYCLFHQIEGLYIDTDVSFSELKGTLLGFARRFFNESTRIRIRPSFFPFTEPSVEIDVECFLCGGKGCGLCKRTGWLEVLGAGMVHPNVLRSAGIDNEKYTGFAFGLGIERIALLKFGIDDIRLLYENDVRFLDQF